MILFILSVVLWYSLNDVVPSKFVFSHTAESSSGGADGQCFSRCSHPENSGAQSLTLFLLASCTVVLIPD